MSSGGRVEFYRSLWGPFTGDVSLLPDICAETVRRGYVGVETNPLMFGERVDEARSVIEDHGLKFLARAHTFGRTVDAHLDFVKRTVDLSHAFGTPHVIVQSGADNFTDAEIDAYFNASANLEADSGFRFAHESHRGCILYSPWVAARVLDRFPEIWLASDYSHYVLVAERYLEWEGDILERCAPRTLHIDARIGTPEMPQVADPRVPEAEAAVTAFVGFWDQIRAASPAEVLTVVPEFGPPPYAPTNSADLDDICEWTKDRLSLRWNG